MQILVGSQNQVKMGAVHNGFVEVWPDESPLSVRGVKVKTGVAYQPLSEDETVMGARNRALRAREIGGADYYVGIEGGMCHSADTWMERTWVVILDRFGCEGIASSPAIMLPPRAETMMRHGADLNDVCVELFGVNDAGAGIGYFGLMTNGALTRLKAYEDAVIFALARFLHPHLFASRPETK